MNELIVPFVLEDYFSKLTSICTNNTIPKCPICKSDMILDGYEFIFTKSGNGYIRRFKCNNCKDKNVILWRK